MAGIAAYICRETKGKKSSVDLGADGWTIELQSLNIQYMRL